MMSSRKSPRTHYLLCVKNEGYPASLELRKVYQALTDPEGSEHGMVRVIDESGEDYLYPASFFVGLELPSAARRAFTHAG